MVSAPCGKTCDDCPLFGTSCEGCIKEMSFSFAYHCREYDRPASEGAKKCTGIPCKVVDGAHCLCPLIIQKSLKPGIKLTSGPQTPIN